MQYSALGACLYEVPGHGTRSTLLWGTAQSCRSGRVSHSSSDGLPTVQTRVICASRGSAAAGGAECRRFPDCCSARAATRRRRWFSAGRREHPPVSCCLRLGDQRWSWGRLVAAARVLAGIRQHRVDDRRSRRGDHRRDHRFLHRPDRLRPGLRHRAGRRRHRRLAASRRRGHLIIPAAGAPRS